jgi:hypothetical protein
MKYEFTRKEIYQWLKEQNWCCGQLEQLLLQRKLKPDISQKSNKTNISKEYITESDKHLDTLVLPEPQVNSPIDNGDKYVGDCIKWGVKKLLISLKEKQK